MYEDLSNYVEQQVQAATPAKLIDLLFCRALRDLTQAVEQHRLDGDARTQAESIRLIVHAQQIVAELDRSLDLRRGGELARNLHRLYEYMQFRLNEGIQARNPANIAEVLALLTELHGGWTTVVQEESGADGATAGAGKTSAFMVA